MTKKEVIGIVNKYYAYHTTNNKSISKFKLSNKVKTLAGTYVVAYGVYFNYDKKLYAKKGKYIYVCALNIKNPFITNNQIYSSLITKEEKSKLYSLGYDSVVLVMDKNIVEVVCFTNSQIEIHDIIIN